MSNTITAFFKGRVGVAEAVYQNDYGLVMNLDSIELPAHFDCYFSTLEQDEAIPGIGADNQVAIPNDCLTRAGSVMLHIPLHTGANDSEVEYVVYFKVIGRARPIDDGTPTQMTAIERALALLSQPITNIEEIVNEALSFTGDTFDEMQEQLDADQAAYESSMNSRATAFEAEIRSDIADVEHDFDVLNGQYQTAVSALTVDSEVQNVRVGDDGVTYASAGEAVRTQFSNLKSEIKPLLMDSYDKADKVALATSAGTWRLDPDTGLSVSNANYMLVKFQVTAGDVLVVDCDDYFQFQTIASVPASGNSNRIGETYGQGQYVVVVPIGATYLVGSSPTQTSTFAVYSAISKFDGQTEINNFVLDTLDNNYKYDAIPATLNSGKLLYSSGQTGDTASTDWKVSDYVDVSDLTYIRIEASTGYSNLFYAKYTDNKTFISGEASGGEISSFAEDVYVGDASYIRFSKFSSNLGTVKEITGLNPRTWTGKKWVCIGDSLTEVNATATKRYYEYITDETGIQTSLYGVGGTGYANPNGAAGNFTTRMSSVPTDADVYTIFGSFNDYEYCINNNIPIGLPTDSGTSTICGYINGAFSALFARVPLANLGVIAPNPWGGVNAVSGSATAKEWAENYTEALRLCCERLSIPFLDLYHHSGMRPWDSAFREVVYTNNDNGTHPNEIGHKIMASKFKSFLETLLM